MECNEIKFDIGEYCRICLSPANESFEIDSYLSLIRCVCQTKLLQNQHTPQKICGSCANALILANIFRLKVIESNGKCRELVKACKKDSNVVNREESVEQILQQSVGKVKTIRRKYFLQDPVSILKVEVEDVEDNTGSFNKNIEIEDMESKVNIKKILELEIAHTCIVCASSLKEKHPLEPVKAVLNKVLPLKENETAESICTNCMDVAKGAKRLFEIQDKIKDVKEEVGCKKVDECQFCLIKDVFSTRTPKYLVHKYNLMPLCRDNEENKINSEAKSCKECMKLLKQIYLLVTQYFKAQKLLEDTTKSPVTIVKEKRSKKETSIDNLGKFKRSKSKSKRLKEVLRDENSTEMSDEEVFPLSKFVKRRRKRVKLRSKPKYVKPNPRSNFPEDFQCHMSDFEEDESDSGILTPRMGEPLNKAFKHRYKYCTECKMKFITDYELEVHYDVVHRTKGDICEHCNKKFINFVGVKAHKFKVHYADCSSVSLFRELCEICGVLTKTLEEHQSVHSDARPFVCHQCGHSSKTKDLLAAHVRAMHTGEKRYGCKYCDKRFSYSADRARHEISSHTKQYKYVCRTCNKGFLKKNFLTSHQKTHEGTFLDEI